MYVLVYPAGINGFDYVWRWDSASQFDVFSWAGGGWTRRAHRLPTSAA